MSATATLPCPHCDQHYSLTAEYLAEYGGQATDCTRCGQAFTLPTAEEIFAEHFDEPESTPALLQIDEAPPVARPVAAEGEGIWRQGKLALVIRGCRLPRRCIRCNAPGEGQQIWVRLTWKPNIGTGSPLISAIANSVMEEELAFRVSLCAPHREKIRKHRRIGLWIILSGLAAFTFVCAFFNLVRTRVSADFIMSLALGSIGVCLIGWAWRTIGGRLLSARFINAQGGEVSGFGKPFLESLIPFDVAVATQVRQASVNLGQISE